MFGKAEERSLKSEYFEPLTKVRLKRRTSALRAYASVFLKKRVLESQLATNTFIRFLSLCFAIKQVYISWNFNLSR